MKLPVFYEKANCLSGSHRVGRLKWMISFNSDGGYGTTCKAVVASSLVGAAFKRQTRS